MEEISTLAPAGAGAAPVAPAEGPRPGTVLGHFVLAERLGSGGMGVVFSAYDLQLNRRVAIKLVRSGASPETRARMVREAQAMARLTHRNVVTVHEVATLGDEVFIAMELVTGPTLRAWLKERPRSRRAILEVFLDAGRGLAAAHRAGITHRDFKPENVLVAPDGRAQVTDFGLAKLEGEAVEAPAGESPVKATVETETGAWLGTPRYMAPEQRRAGPVDARSDQYAFAVVLYEALVGAHPFMGTDEPRRRRLPRWLRAALAPALAEDPAARYPSMAPLLARLEAGPRARRRALVLLGAAAAIGAIALQLRRPERPAPCLGAAARLAGVWDPEVTGAVRAAFLGTGRSYAAATYAQVAATLDDYARGWARMRTEACEASLVRHEQSPALLDLRMACLDRRLAQLEALTRLDARAPAADVLDRAVGAARGLGPLDDCADTQALLAAYPPAEDRRVRVEVAALRGRLDHASALAAAARTRAALTVAEPIVVEARTLGYPPLAAEALGLLGKLQKDPAPESAVATLSEAVRAAGAAHDDARVAEALEGLVWTYGYGLKRAGEARALIAAAEAAVLRAGDPPRRRGDLLYTRAVVESYAGNTAEARRLHEEALALREQSFGPDDADVLRSLNGLGVVLQRGGDYAGARRRFQQGLDQCARTVGATHPYALFILANLGAVAEEQGRYGESLAYSMRALAIALDTYGPDHPYIVAALINMANAQSGLGYPDAARANMARALAVREQAFGADSAQTAEAIADVAAIDLDLGHLDEALAGYRRSLAVYERKLGPEHADLAGPLTGIGDVLREQRRPRAAMAFFERALALQVKAYGADSVRAAVARAHLADCATDAGDVATAVALAEAAVPVIERAGDSPGPVGRARFALARALWASGNGRARALALAEDARRDLQTAAAQRSLAEVSSWLAERRPRSH
jgi:serine/threonine-protein kinase